MPPKKNKDSILEKKPPEKVVKKRVRAVKPKLKVPTVVKVKIPLVQSLVTKPTPKLTRKQLTPQVKMDLANEVANAQLVKAGPMLINPIELVKTVRQPRKKKVVSKFFNDDETTATAETPKEVKLLETKTTEGSETQKKSKVTTKKRVIASTEKPQPAKKPRIMKPKTGVANNSKTTKNKKEVTSEQSQEVVTKSNNNVRRPRTRLTRGKVNKPDDIPTDTHNSPSILEQMVYENEFPSNVGTSNEKTKAISIESRKTSVTSSSSISWTKDISSSSATTCLTVTSNDFVRFNRKIPVISLTNVDCDFKKAASIENESSSSSSSSSDSDSSSGTRKSKSDIEGSFLDINSHLLNLSTSSDSPHRGTKNNVNQIGYSLDKLSAQLKRFDLEIVNWIGYQNDLNNDAKKFHDKIIEVFKEESDVIMHCRQIKTILAGDTNEDVRESIVNVSPEKSRDLIEFNIPNADLDLTSDNFDGDTHFDSPYSDSILKSCNKNITPPVNSRKDRSLPSSDGENFTSDKVNYVPFDHNNDDDDALSLFAESITGFESSRMNSSIRSTPSVQHDEYIPEPIAKVSPEKFVYCPTKITNRPNEQILNSKNRTICEKQNADSTSIKESEMRTQNSFTVPYAVNQDSAEHLQGTPPLLNCNTPCLMANRYKRTHGQKSVVFRGVCFFNMLSSCKNRRCRFPHIELSVMEIRNRLMRLTEEMFIQEYISLRNWPTLRRKYGLCYIEECQRRDLTRILIEMSIDYVMKMNSKAREDVTLKTEAVESTLLHLNSVDLIDHKDLLMYKVAKGHVLCDVYMQVIADTQNFSRFKSVFINLIHFIIDNGRTFKLSVTEHILERVCILPYEEPLIRAVVDMIRNTDSSILQNSMIRLFEKQVENVGIDFFEGFLEYKRQANMNQPVLRAPYIESPPLLSEETAVNNSQTEREKRYTSPDTTNLDSSNKLMDEPIITRTINMNPSRLLGLRQSFKPAKDFSPKINYNNWKNKSILSKMLNGLSPQMNIANKPLTPPHQANQRQVTYKTSPTKYPRRSGADF